MRLIDLLKLPEKKNIKDLNAPSTTLLHGEIIRKKPFLRRVYVDFYKQFVSVLSGLPPNAKIVELGSGSGFVKEILPDIITSEILDVSGVDIRLSAKEMPFGNETIDAVIMTNVFHHIPDSRAFLKEAERCLKVGGKILMIEPANTLFSRFIYQTFHHEYFDPKGEWSFESEGPLSSANGAIPWIIFFRDRKKFQEEFPCFTVNKIKNHTPLRYFLSGGFSFKQLVPSFSYSLFTFVEFLLSSLNGLIGMFITIELTKTSK